MWTFDVVIRLKIYYNREKKYAENIENDRYFIHHRYDNDISKKPILKTPIRYDTDNIGIADIIDDTDTIDPSLLSTK